MPDWLARDTNILLMDMWRLLCRYQLLNNEVQIIMLVYYFKVSLG